MKELREKEKVIQKQLDDGIDYASGEVTVIALCTITSVRGVVKPAFQMAYNEDIIRRNPFDFKLVDVVPNNSQKRIAMTEEQQELWVGFIREDKTYTKYFVEKTKTECGCRFIPMTEEVYRSLKNILTRRKSLKTEMIVDGYNGFLLLDKDDKPKAALHIENEMRWAMKKYKKLYPTTPITTPFARKFA